MTATSRDIPEAGDLAGDLASDMRVRRAQSAAATAGHKSEVLELFVTVLLSLATVTSAWCAYQASVSGGEQSMHLAEAGRADRQAMEDLLEAGQHRVVDAVVFLHYVTATTQGNDQLASLLQGHLDPGVQNALEAWLESDQRGQMPHYAVESDERAKLMLARSREELDEAQRANLVSDRYVMLTVLCASVLFLGGIATRLKSRVLQSLLAAVGGLLWLGCLGYLTTLPRP